MCCGNRVVANQAAAASEPAPTWNVLDASGKTVATKTSLIAAKLAAARIAGGSYEKA